GTVVRMSPVVRRHQPRDVDQHRGRSWRSSQGTDLHDPCAFNMVDPDGQALFKRARRNELTTAIERTGMRPATDVDALADVVFLLDVDNTLLDNDAVIDDLRRHVSEAFGTECAQRYWEIFENLRRELGYADYLGSLQRYRVEHPRDPHLLRVSLFLLHYPFTTRVYPGALDVLAALRLRG